MSKLIKYNSLLIWLLLCLNLVLLVMCNPGILNPGPAKPFSVMFQNVRGFVPFSKLGVEHPPLDVTKTLEFQDYVHNNKPDLVILNETWLTSSHNDNEILPNTAYKIFRLDRSPRSHPMDPANPTKFKRRGGGVLIAIRSDVAVESKLVNLKCGAEILSIELKFGANNIFCISSLYRVGTLGENHRNEVNNYLRKLASSRKYKKHCLIGDLNLSNTSWPEGDTNVELERGFVDLFNDLGFEQLIDRPTHERGKVLDLLLTNVPRLVSNVNILSKNEVCSSDHFGITFNLGEVKRTSPPKRKLFNFKRANWDSLNSDLKRANWDRILYMCDAQTAWYRFKGILLDLCKTHIPTVTSKAKLQPPWFDSETHSLCREKERLRSRYKETKSASDYAKFSSCRKRFKELVQEKMASNFDDEDDPAIVSKKFWSHVKSSSVSARIPETVSYNGKFRNNPQDQSELFNTYFADQFSTPSSYNINIDFSTEYDDDMHFTHRDVRKLLRKMNSNKAPGPDGIHGKILKNCAEGICYPLTKNFKISYNTGQIPNEWKLANVVPVHKKGSKLTTENYRPISLTCLVMKIFESLVRDELMKKCQNLITDKQHGFLPQRSCTTQLVPFSDSLALSLNDASRTDVVYFDFAKAFDSVNHDIILGKLKSNFNINGKLLKFMVNYLQDRQQRVVIGGHYSTDRVVTSGVPQGSILGPLLFVLFINDMPDVVSEGTNLLLYADETKIWRRISDWNDHVILQNDILSLFNWSRLNLMTFHPHKCKVLSVTLQHSTFVHDIVFPFHSFHYCLDGTDRSMLEYVTTEKDLGVEISNRFSWCQHVSALYNKASSRLGLTRRVCHFVNCKVQKRILYLALVRSLFEHVSVIWHPSGPQVSNLERIQKRGVKWILGEEDHHYSDYEYTKRLVDLKIMPLSSKFIFTDLILFHQIFYELSVIQMPDYITRVTDDDIGRLRSSHLDALSLKCSVESTLEVFRQCFFFRTFSKWNNLDLSIRSLTDPSEFRSALEIHIWKWTTLDENSQTDDDPGGG